MTYGFQLLKEKAVPELNLFARLYRHERTGAELLSIETEDENKVFGITFRTTPSDSTGIAHILEHSVLAGSRKYPVKDPFNELNKGSLNTFLNAFTYPDKTCYPVASTNLQDFYNLIEVYVDAVLHPLLSPYTLYQEGWHYEVNEDEGQSLAFSGVVFNEMKGAYSTPESVLHRRSMNQVFPDTTYGVDSGGDPEKIPDLTYEQFKAFHETYYHPSNARIFFYGDDNPEERLRRMDAYLQEFEQIPVRSEIALQQPFGQPRQVRLPYDSGEDPVNAKRLVTVNWLLPEAGEIGRSLEFTILGHILLGTPASPLYKALIDSGLGEDITGVGMETGLRQMFFSAGLKGVDQENSDKVEPLILATLEHLARNGIDPGTIAASMNTIEFMLRENNTGSFPRGLAVMLQALDAWLYGADPIDYLAFEQPLQELKTRLAGKEQVFETLIEQHFIQNHHRVTVVLDPDSELGKQRQQAELSRLESTRKGLSDEDLRGLRSENEELKRRQEAQDSPEALAVIPMLKRSDLDPQIKRIPVEILQSGKSPLLTHELPTNGILYLDLGMNLRALPQEWLPYLPIFSRAQLETGTSREDFVELIQRIGRTTGGIRTSVLTSPMRQSPAGIAWLFLRGKAMADQAGELLAILQDVLASARLDDRERIMQMVLEEKAGMESSLAGAGHRYTNLRLKAKFNLADWVSEQMSGVSQLSFVRQLSQQVEQNWEQVHEILESIRTALVTQENMICNLTAEGSILENVRPQIEAFMQSFPSTPVSGAEWRLPEQAQYEGLAMPAQVNFVGKAANLYELGYQFHGSALAITPYLRNTWLYERVRVQGGAYGVFDLFDRLSGVITFLSYRDPRLIETLQVYKSSGEFLANCELNDSELTKAIITAIGNLDAYQLPDAKGYTSMMRYLAGISDEERQQIRDEVLSTTVAHFRQFGEILRQIREDDPVVVLGSWQAIEAANQERGGWLQVEKLL